MHTSPLAFSRLLRRIFPWALLVGYISVTAPAMAGEMYRWLDEQGRVHLTDTPPKPKGPLQEIRVYHPSARGEGPEPSDPVVVEPGRVKMAPTKPGGAVVVEAMLNRRLSVPMLLDTGADFTVLTRQAAKDLRLSPLEHLPKLEFKTAGGVVRFPVATLQSMRVGTAEARDVNVAIDGDGHLPMGLLGMTFLRHFRVTVDQARGQVTFER